MEVTFSICNINDHKVKITGLSNKNNLYVPENIQIGLESYYINNIFKYSETNTVNIVLYNSSSGTNTTNIIYNDHNKEEDISEFKLEKDGYYTIYQIILPTVRWYNSLTDKSFLKGKNIFLIENNKIYEVTNNRLEERPEELLLINNVNSNISKDDKKTFSICYLRECYINISKKLLNYPIQKCSNKMNSELSFKRDFIWMTLNVIKYEVELNMLYEAQLILEKINRCGEFCNGNIIDSNNDCGC